MGACLSENDVLAVVAGRIPEPELRAIEAHLDTCGSCRSVIACVAGSTVSRPEPTGTAAGVPERIGRYHILRRIGAGAMGTVYAARDPELDRVVAVKLLLPSLAASTTLRARLAREAQAMARLAHPNVIAVHDIGSLGDQLFVAMEFVDGGTLRSWLGAAPRDWRAVTEVLTAAGRGLAAAHAAGVIHRDFKPDNVLVGSDGRVRVTDFGLAQLDPASAPTAGEVPQQTDAVAVSLSGAGALLGTPAYMAPEQLRGDACDERSDIFGFCTTGWEALYGRRPFAGRDLAELRTAVCEGKLEPRPDRSRIPDRLHQAIARGLVPAPEQRWPSMAALLAAIDAAVRPRERRSRRARVAIGGVLVAVAASGGAIALALRPAHPAPSTAERGERRALAVLDLIDDEGTASSLGVLLTGRLAVELGAGGALRLVPSDASRRVAERIAATARGAPTREVLADLRRTLGADLVLSGRHGVSPGGALHLAVEIRDTATAEIAARIALPGSTQELADLAAGAGQALRRQLGLRDVAGADLVAARKALPANPEAARLFSDGQALLGRGDAGRAREAFDRALQLEPDQPSVLAALASAWKALEYDQRERDAARRAFERTAGLPRELALRVEAQYREALRDWARAAEIWVTLTTFFPDELDYGLRLVQDLTRAGKLAEAQARLDRLRQLAPPAGSDPRIDLVEVDVAAARGQRDRALAAADRAAAAAERLHGDLLVARAREQTCALFQDAGRFDDALAACRDGLDRFDAAGDRGGVAGAAASLAVLLIRFQKYDEARAPAARALAIYRDIGSQTGVAMVTSRIALAYAYVGDLAHAEQHMTEAVALYHEANEPSREAMVLHNLASVMTEQGKLADAERYYRRTVEGARAAEMRELETLALANLAVNLLRQGELADARTSARSAVALSRDAGDARRMVYALATLGQILLRMGELGDARKALEEARDRSDEIGATGTPVGQYLAELTAAEGDLEGAEALAQRAAADYRQKKMAIGEVYALTVDARLLFRLGRSADATRATTRMRALAEQIGFDHVREEVAAPLALARAASGDVAGASADVEGAIAHSERLHLVDANLAQRLVLAGLEQRRGRPAAARRILADLEAEARRRGFHQLVKEIQASRSVATTSR